MIPVEVVKDPELALEQRIHLLCQSDNQTTCFVLQYDYCQYYLPKSPVVSLLALIVLEKREEIVAVCAAVCEASVTRHGVSLLDRLGDTDPSPADCQTLATEFDLAWVDLQQSLSLSPIAIPKPWGQEIWYTGIEARGQSQVSANGKTCPLPWLLSLAPKRLVGGMERRLTLLKILDPLAEEVYGDLYFEMHEEKQEVYVVTHIDKTAWPDGVGGIRFGFDDARRAAFADDEAFKQAYLEAVQAYEKIRREIDACLDQKRQSQGLALDEPVDADTLKAWHDELSPALLQVELQRRRAMDAFTATKSLRLGDVVKVPCFTPHSLQHGVRTVEFQTPVYERKILAFGQKVLTQPHWDTESAVELLNMDTPEQPALGVLFENNQLRIEEVVDFDDFEVHRYSVSAGVEITLPDTNAYGVIMAVEGCVVQGQQTLLPESAALLTACLADRTIGNPEKTTAVFLLAAPKISL